MKHAALMRTPFARIKPNYRVNRGAGEAEIYIYDEIGFFGITAMQFVQDLEQINADTLHVRINSPGGSVFEGITIANALRRYAGNVITHVDGLAASIASLIAIAGKEIRIAENAYMMIHEPWSLVIGPAETLRQEADLLDKISGTLQMQYVEQTGQKQQTIAAAMAAETWFTAAEAVDYGLADALDVEAPAEEQAQFDLSIFNHVPESLLHSDSDTVTKRDLERALRDAGCPAKLAKTILSRGMPDAQRDVDSGQSRDAVDGETLQRLTQNRKVLHW